MKVLHINTNQEGGAAWCARRINCALARQGVESNMLFAEGDSMPFGVEGGIAGKDKIVLLRNYWFFSALRYHLLMRLPGYWNKEKLTKKLLDANTGHIYINQPLSEFSDIAYHPLIKWADIIHLHWVPNFVDYPTFFKRVKKPIVWTLHDEYPILGVMHFESEFTQLPKQLKEIDLLCRKIKKDGLSRTHNLHIVAISDKMKNAISASDIMNKYPVTLIHNGVDTEIFKKDNIGISIVTDFIKNLNKNTKVFMFSSFFVWDKRKGLGRVIQALEVIHKSNDVALIVVGRKSDGDVSTPFPMLYTGLIKEQEKLASIYSSVDYFINGSYEEAFAQTPLESMACGTPVISTPCSGAKDLIRAFNGVISDGFDSNSIAKAIKKAMSIQYDSNAIRKYVVDNYDYSIIAKEYIDLYRNILNQ